jgi:hypothetical protein
MEAIEDVTNAKYEGYLALNDSIVHLILHCDGKGLKTAERKKLKEVSYVDSMFKYCKSV